MGIRKISKLLKDLNLPSFTKFETIVEQRRDCCFIAIDANLYLMKYFISIGDVIFGILIQCRFFLSRGIMPVYVFDSSSYVEQKKWLHVKRRKKRQGRDWITREDIQNVQDVLALFKIPVIHSPCEADGILARLSALGVVDICLSDDLDIVAMGCKGLIRKENERFTVYNNDHICQQLACPSLIVLAALLGCDYSPGIRRETIHNLLRIAQQAHDDIDEALRLVPSQGQNEVKIKGAVKVFQDQVCACDSYIINQLQQKIPLSEEKASYDECKSHIYGIIKRNPQRYSLLKTYSCESIAYIVNQRNQMTSLIMGERQRCIYPNDATEYFMRSG